MFFFLRRRAPRPPWRLHWFEIALFALFVLAVALTVAADFEDAAPAYCGNSQSSAVVISR